MWSYSFINALPVLFICWCALIVCVGVSVVTTCLLVVGFFDQQLFTPPHTYFCGTHNHLLLSPFLIVTAFYRFLFSYLGVPILQ